MKTCSRCREDGCLERPHARGLCSKHYGEWYRREHPDRVEKAQRRYREENAEAKREGFRAYRERNLASMRQRSLDWYYENRERLQADPEFRERRRQIGKRWEVRHPEKVKENSRRHIAKTHGLPLEEYDAILARGCALCGTHEVRLCLDHDHTTGKVRDALCHKCNAALGLLRDDPALLRAGANYIEQHRKEVMPT